MKFTRYYLTETDAESLEAADAIFDRNAVDFGPDVTVISEGASVMQKPVESGVTIVVCVRDPDWDNAYEVFPGDEPGVEIFDVDLGRADLSDENEFADWYFSHMEDVERLRKGGHAAAADHYAEVIEGQMPEDFDPDTYAADAA